MINSCRIKINKFFLDLKESIFERLSLLIQGKITYSMYESFEMCLNLKKKKLFKESITKLINLITHHLKEVLLVSIIFNYFHPNIANFLLILGQYFKKRLSPLRIFL